MNDKVHIGVGIPSNGLWNTNFGLCLAALAAKFNQWRLGTCKSQTLSFISVQGSMLPQLRERIVLKAQKAGCTHLLMLDSDMTFPPDLIKCLFAHNKDIVAANCVTKRIPAEVTASLDGHVPLFTNDDSRGIQKVHSVGTAVMLVKMSVFAAIERPWFKQEWVPEIQHFMGEDRFFCQKTRDAGFEIWIDHNVSKKVGHIGYYEFTHDVVGEVLQDSEAA
jgi:hypothetical protein